MSEWFARLRPVHQMRGRVRFRYRLQPGMPDSAQRLETALLGIEGVRAVRVNPRAHAIVVQYAHDSVDVAVLAAAVLRLPPPEAGLSEAASARMPDMEGVAVAGGVLAAMPAIPAPLKAPVSLAVALPVWGEALEDLAHKGISSHVLEALAVAISVGRRDYTAANTTTFLLALGEYLEESIARKSDDLLKHLLQPSDSNVWVERDGVEAQVPPSQVSVGDTVIAATGAVVAVDGTVLGGEALLNEATMTGESVPVVRRRGDRVLSGTLVVEGRIRIYAEQVGEQAVAARIADFVEQSLIVKSHTQLEASRLADRLVPMVLGLAGATWLFTSDWARVAAVLQADYSCALKLATPVAFKAAMYQAGRAGMLIKGATALEKLAEADTFVFDKTGTLSSGELMITDSVSFGDQYTPEDLINLAASVEEHYFHPLALAVVEAARRLDRHRHFNHKEVEFIVAHGVASVIDGKRIVVGSRHFVEDDEKIPVSRPQRKTLEALLLQGKTLLYIGFGGELIGVLALMDSMRSNSAATVARLRALGVRRIYMLTGDHEQRARDMAQRLGLDGYRAGLMPHEKADALKQFSASGSKVAFIGDGVNDAPALSGAHVGIAMQRGADIARLAADIALLEDDIARVADARELALATRKLINSNFGLTVGLNTSILGAAALGLLTPVAASMLHNGSTIGILLRALSGAGLKLQQDRNKDKRGDFSAA